LRGGVRRVKLREVWGRAIRECARNCAHKRADWPQNRPWLTNKTARFLDKPICSPQVCFRWGTQSPAGVNPPCRFESDLRHQKIMPPCLLAYTLRSAGARHVSPRYTAKAHPRSPLNSTARHPYGHRSLVSCLARSERFRGLDRR
jgi:hypothetical protein